MISNEIILRVGCSSDKRRLFDILSERFNSLEYQLPSGTAILVECVQLPADSTNIGELELDAVTPESTLWLRNDRLSTGNSTKAYQTFRKPTIFASSPIVLAVWKDVAAELGYPQTSIRFESIVNRANTDPTFKWGQTNSGTTVGRLTALAMMEATNDSSAPIIKVDLARRDSYENLKSVQRSITYYAPDETHLVTRAIEEGRKFLDAFMVQEHLFIQINRRANNPLIAVSPPSGVVRADHPISFLNQGTPDEARIQAYELFCSFLRSPEIQTVLLAEGFHPTNPLESAYLNSVKSAMRVGVSAKFAGNTSKVITYGNEVTTDAVAQIARIAKRKTNVLLVIDTSSSMSGEPLDRVKMAAEDLVQRIEGPDDRLGLIGFSDLVTEVTPLLPVSSFRSDLIAGIKSLTSHGNTALLDAVSYAYEALQRLRDDDGINSVILLTDGRENQSTMLLDEVIERISEGDSTKIPVFIYCVAYTRSADHDLLESISKASRGRVYEGNPTDIYKVYEFLSGML